MPVRKDSSQADDDREVLAIFRVIRGQAKGPRDRLRRGCRAWPQAGFAGPKVKYRRDLGNPAGNAEVFVPDANFDARIDIDGPRDFDRGRAQGQVRIGIADRVGDEPSTLP